MSGELFFSIIVGSSVIQTESYELWLRHAIRMRYSVLPTYKGYIIRVFFFFSMCACVFFFSFVFSSTSFSHLEVKRLGEGGRGRG